MRYLASSTLPVILFGGCVLFIYYLYARLWLTWVYRKIRKKNTGKLLTNRWAILLHSVAGAGLLCLLYGHFVEPYRVQVNTIPIKTQKLKKTHFRIVQISDTHCEGKIRLEETLPDVINGLKPDIIVFTGDTINCPSALTLFKEMMTKLEAPLGKFAVTGNCDFRHWSDLDLFGGTGFEELRLHEKKVEKDGEFITVIGLAFENGRQHSQAVGKLRAEDFNLFMYHNTDLMDYFDGLPVDLYLCGHTHGGQIALPFYGALITLSRHGKKYEAGLYRQGLTQLYVNRGIGLEGGLAPRARFFARPEITVFDICPEMQ
jgi:hypothetical protein